MVYIEDNRQVWVSRTWLINNGISAGTQNSWAVRGVTVRKSIEDHACIYYDSIPASSLQKLPQKETLIKEVKHNNSVEREEYYYEELLSAYESYSVGRWRNDIKTHYPNIKPQDATKFAQRAAVLDRASKVYNGKYGELNALYNAFIRVIPDMYTNESRLCSAISKAKKEGVLSVAVDKRAIRTVEPIYKADIQYWAMFILGHNKAYSITKAYNLFASLCRDKEIKPPHYNWFRDYYRKNRNIIDYSRLGASAYAKKNQPYAKIEPALYTGDQWQMDGWTIPIYCKKAKETGGYEYFVKYTLFAVLDAHSRKIVGFDIAESENTETILKGLERAVKSTHTLPYEIVADNHSFNRTKEAGNIKLAFDSLGVTWTVDSNPRRKAILERAFKKLGEEYLIHYYGYIGQGIKTREETGRTQQELIDIYTTPDNFLTIDQLKATMLCAIDDYNSGIIKKLKDCPNNLYVASEQPNAIKVDEFTHLQLFIRGGEYKITKGQLIIKRGAYQYEYQLPASVSSEYGNKTVIVRYADFDLIYLYDAQTDEPICSVPQKFIIQGATANQSTEDTTLLFKNKGRLKGISTGIKRHKETLYDEASTINSEAYEAVNVMTTPKDVIAKIRQKYELRQMAIEHNLNPENIAPLPEVSEMLDNSLKPRKKNILHPFSKQTEITVIDINTIGEQ